VQGRSVTLFGVNLCAIPLVTDKGTILASSMASLTTTTSVSTTTFTDTGLAVTVAVNRVSMSNALFMAASINSASGGTAVQGMWQFETRKTGESWTSTGIETRRYFSGANDHGAVSLFGLAPNLTNGTYEVRLIAKSLTEGVTLRTFNSTLVAFSLSYTNSTGSGSFAASTCKGSASTNNTATFTKMPGVECVLTPATNMSIFAALSFAGKTESGANKTGEYRLALTNSTGQVRQAVDVERYFSDTADWGSVGMATIFTNISAGVSTITGEQEVSSGSTLTDYIWLTTFSTVSDFLQNPPTPTLFSFF
jgi:hypothetical protein